VAARYSFAHWRLYRPRRRLLAWRITLNSFILIVASYLVARTSRLLGISIPVVQVGGGLIVISNGWAMLTQKDPDERGQIQKNMNPADILRRAFYLIAAVDARIFPPR